MQQAIIFDFNRTLYDPEMQTLAAGALFTLQTLHARGHKLYLISRKESNREDLIKNLGIARYFSNTAFFPEKTEEAFKAFMERNGIKRDETIIVGDRAREEIAIGGFLGIKTIWVQNGKFANELPRSKEEEPTFRVAQFEEILNIVL